MRTCQRDQLLTSAVSTHLAIVEVTQVLLALGLRLSRRKGGGSGCPPASTCRVVAPGTSGSARRLAWKPGLQARGGPPHVVEAASGEALEVHGLMVVVMLDGHSALLDLIRTLGQGRVGLGGTGGTRDGTCCGVGRPQPWSPWASRTLTRVASASCREEVRVVSVPTATGLTYDDLADLPQDDHLRRELIDGELYVSPSPIVRHQRAVARIAATLLAHADQHGGLVLPAPIDVVFAEDTAVQPDVVYLSADRAEELSADRVIGVVPDLLVEVSSSATRRLDLIKKRNLYEREGVPEYWFVDLEADQVDVHCLDGAGRYGQPRSLGAGEQLTCLAAPGFELSVAEALAR